MNKSIETLRMILNSDFLFKKFEFMFEFLIKSQEKFSL